MIWTSGGDDDLSIRWWYLNIGGDDDLNIRWWWYEHQVVMIWASGGDLNIRLWWFEHQVVMIWTSGDDQIIWTSGDDDLSIKWAPVVIIRWWCNHCDLNEHHVMMNVVKHQVNPHTYITHIHITHITCSIVYTSLVPKSRCDMFLPL